MNVNANASAERRACRGRCITRHLSDRRVDESTAVRCERVYARSRLSEKRKTGDGGDENSVRITHVPATSESARGRRAVLFLFFAFVKTKSKNTACAYTVSRRHVSFVVASGRRAEKRNRSPIFFVYPDFLRPFDRPTVNAL